MYPLSVVSHALKFNQFICIVLMLFLQDIPGVINNITGSLYNPINPIEKRFILRLRFHSDSVLTLYDTSNMTLPSVSQSTTTQTRLECNHLAFSQGNKSYFYNNVNKTCIIYPNKIHWIESLVPHPGFEYFVEDGPACGPPPVPKGHQLLEVIGSAGNYIARYQCDQLYVHRQIGETRCIGDSDWTETPCKDFASCATIKECNSSYTTDGEYIHYPGILNSSSVRLYCHNMNTSNPKTYLTLNATNTTWRSTGYAPHFTVNRTDFVVQLRGDGGCGGATPTDGLIQFVKNPQYTIPTGTIDPQCNLLGL
ncbi:hypothetical protein LOTGIDRAFT_162926 [Lottia gigantea]|uniref:GON domain-containing protein n=1 Tax=Lottia gigantea TaxID=225164 RepID=V4AA41_LOTGI|nr:hypothetical protein LOTGIDRAFT_162926 [Lottia gigantea]ESO91925.1 hypothetical protein LOTGIDRAFT_162926 [Lottia gigantea]